MLIGITVLNLFQKRLIYINNAFIYINIPVYWINLAFFFVPYIFFSVKIEAKIFEIHSFQKKSYTIVFFDNKFEFRIFLAFI